MQWAKMLPLTVPISRTDYQEDGQDLSPWVKEVQCTEDRTCPRIQNTCVLTPQPPTHIQMRRGR